MSHEQVRAARCSLVLLTFALGSLALWGCGEEEPRSPSTDADRGKSVAPDRGGRRGQPFFRTRGRERPNVIVLMADDLGLLGWRRGLPRTRRVLGGGGTEFTDSIVSTPLCCPSRATFLTGRYGHNNAVLANDPGYPAMRGKREVLPRRLQRAGYRTAMVGKFMNGWDRTAAGERGEPAPGWDDWVEMRRTFAYYDYELNVNGELESRGDGEEDYLTDVLTEHGLDALDRAAGSPQPLFMWMSWWAPHPELSEATEGPCQGSAIPRSREPEEFGGERLRQTDSVDEADVRDKPAFIRRKRDLRPGDRQGARLSLRCRLASLRAVDRGVEAVVDRLRELGELSNTVLVFTSDNGFFHLEHRFPNGKGAPYEEAVRVPLVIDAPAHWGRQVARSDVQVSNVDLAPTILELAGACDRSEARGCERLDGLSLLPLLSPGAPRDLRRRDLLVESADGKPCGYEALRTSRFTYVEYEERRGEGRCPAGERELYDRRSDPYQLDNLLHGSTADPPPGLDADLSRRLRRLARCGGAVCSDARD